MGITFPFMDGDPALQAQVVLRSGFGALVAGMFGMGWLGSGLGIVHAFTPAVFRQARYYFWGITITIWCSVCAILFRSNTLVAWSNIGTGVLLWANCAHGLLRAGGIVRALAR